MKEIAIGVDIGGTRTKIGLVDLSMGKVVEMIVTPTEKKSADTFINDLKKSINELLENESIEKKLVKGIGFGIPGFVFENGMVDSTYGFIDFMEDYPLVKIIEHQCGLPCKIDNDARIVALGEALYGEAKNYNLVLVLTLGTGLGLGFVVDKKLEGRLPYSHMGGHISIIENGVTCYCGKQGCLESLVSATGIVNAAISKGWQKKNAGVEISAEMIFKAALSGDKNAEEIILTMVRHLKTGIDNYINIYAPDVIVIGGGVAKGMQPYLPLLENKMVLRPFKNYRTAMLLSTLDEHSGILGSAALFND